MENGLEKRDSFCLSSYRCTIWIVYLNNGCQILHTTLEYVSFMYLLRFKHCFINCNRFVRNKGKKWGVDIKLETIDLYNNCKYLIYEESYVMSLDTFSLFFQLCSSYFSRLSALQQVPTDCGLIGLTKRNGRWEFFLCFYRPLLSKWVSAMLFHVLMRVKKSNNHYYINL